MSFTNQQPFSVTNNDISGFTGGRRSFNCSLCGHVFVVGDVARWVYANFADSPVRCGNFFVCQNCDGDTADVLQCAKLSFEETVKTAKRWGVYGPDWLGD